MATIYMTDDVHRPDDGNGNPIEQSSSELAITINGYSYDWYFSARCDFNTNKSDVDSRNARVQCINRLFLNGSFTPSTLPTLRFVYRLFYNNDPETYFEEKIVNLLNWYTGVDIDIFSRTNPNTSGLTRTYGTNRNLASSTSFYFTGTNSEIQDMEYNVGCKIQGLVNGDWVDINRSGKNTPWKIFVSYAPFYQSITPPTHFYANGINTFTAPIGSKYKTNYTDILIKGRYQTTYSANRIVRNINPPYITKGQSTQYLYFCPCLPVSEPEFSKYKTYEFWVELSVTDPSDSDYEIIVARRKVSGSVEYLDEDDFSMYGTPTYSIADTSSMYEQYDVFLRNVTTQIVLSVNVSASYGAPAYASYTTNQSSGYFPGDVESGFGSVVVPLSTNGNSEIIRLYVRASGSYLLSETVTIPIIDYSVPSLPTASIHRCDSDGTANDNGDHCRIDWAVAITSINNQNSKKLTIRHPEGTTEFDPLDSYTQSGSLIVAASTESTYGIDFTVSDDLNTITKSLRLSTAQAVLDLLYGGGGVAFGKVANVQDAVEISELWKLICYKLMLNGIDMNKWVKQLESRVGALEQFAGNTGSTTQFQVSFFNGSELLARNWIRSGQDATEPSQVPTKDATQKKTYSFAGWSKSSAASTVDSDALTNITAHRDLYAVFREDIRYYTVRFISDGEVIKTGDNLQYQYSLARPNTPTKTGYVFVGWCPSGRIINGDTDAIAQFWDNSEITDDWATIMEAVSNGTATQFYKPGQYKVLDCGANGSITMRIKGFKLDKIANSEKRVQLSWESVDLLAQTKRINPAYQAGTEGTGALGGWSKSELRQWLNGEFYNSIDSVVRNQIKSVGKSTTSRDVNGNSVRNEITIDKIFIPSAEEIIGHYQYLQYNASNVFEVDGMDFMYTDSAYTAKKAYGTTTNIEYWLRTVSRIGHDSFLFYRSLSEINTDTANKSKGICIGFCT